MFMSWCRKLFGHPTPPNRRTRRAVRRPLECEFLEDRTVPTFLAPVNVPVGASAAVVVVGDFNGDGKQDLAISNLNNTIATTLGNGDGTFQAPIISASTGNSWAMVTGDFNHDGKLDLAANANGGVSIDIILGNGDGTFQPRVAYATGSYANRLATGDLNNDRLRRRRRRVVRRSRERLRSDEHRHRHRRLFAGPDLRRGFRSRRYQGRRPRPRRQTRPHHRQPEQCPAASTR